MSGLISDLGRVPIKSSYLSKLYPRIIDRKSCNNLAGNGRARRDADCRRWVAAAPGDAAFLPHATPPGRMTSARAASASAPPTSSAVSARKSRYRSCTPCLVRRSRRTSHLRAKISRWLELICFFFFFFS